jgi:group II intron reverse transcriptase/maturase
VHQVIRTTINQGYNWVVDGDIAQYFDTIDHAHLLRLVRQRISDRRVLRLIRAWLQDGVLTKQGWVPSERGTPQGGVLSPVLANIYLHEVDRQWHQQYVHLGRLLRYADDFVILCRRYREAQESQAVIQALLAQLSLRLHPEKTRLVDLYQGKQGFDFLGFHFHKCASWQYRGRHYCLSWPSTRAMRQIRQKVKTVTADWRRLPFPMASVVASLTPILRGWVNYFRIGNSSRQFLALDRYVFDRLALFRRRKYQRRQRTWPTDDYQRLGVFRASGQVKWAAP